MKLEDGKEYYYWHKNLAIEELCLMTGTLFKCEKCDRHAMVNGVWLTKNNSPEVLKTAETEANEVGEITDELCLTDDGDNICEQCYYSKTSSNDN